MALFHSWNSKTRRNLEGKINLSRVTAGLSLKTFELVLILNWAHFLTILIQAERSLIG
jgi:hypothetical protein